MSDSVVRSLSVSSPRAIAGSLWALFLGIAFIMLGSGLQGSLLGLRAALEGFSTAVTGLIMSGYYFGFLAGSALAPRIVRRVGHIRVFTALASLASAAVLLHAVFVVPATWAGMRVVSGFAYAGLFVVAESWLNDRASNEMRGRVLAIYMVVMFAGMGGGQFLLIAADPLGFELFVLTSILVSVALIPIALTAARAPEIAEPAHVSLPELYRISPLGVIGTFGTGAANGAFFGMGTVYAAAAGLEVVQISLFMGVTIFGGIVCQWPLGRLSDRIDRRLVLTGITFIAAAMGLLAAFIEPSIPVLFGLMAIFGGMTLSMYSLSVAHTNDFLEAEQFVAASAGLVLVGGLGACLGPVAASLFMDAVGPNGFFLWLASVHGAIGAFALYRMSRRRSRPVEDQHAYVAFPARASPMAAALNAEADEADETP